MSAPNTRIRGKSTPRGRSPNPKSLRKVVKGRGSDLVTPPPSTSSRRSSSKSATPKVLTFGTNTEHSIEAENKVEKGGMKKDKADAIFKALKQELIYVSDLDLYLFDAYRVMYLEDQAVE